MALTLPQVLQAISDTIKGKKISELTQKSTLDGTEEIYINDGGADRKCTTQQAADLALVDINTDDVNVINDDLVSHLGTLSEHMAHNSSPYIALGAEITDNGDGTITITEGEVWTKKSNQLDAHFIAVKVPEDTLSIPDGTNQSVYIKRSPGSPDTWYYDTDASSPGVAVANWDWVVFALCQRVGSTIHYYNFKNGATNSIYKLLLRIGNLEIIRYWYGAQVAETGTRNFTVAQGAFYILNEQLITDAVDTSGSDTFSYYYVTGSVWTRTSGQSQIDNLQFNNPATGLVTLANNKFGVHWVYYVLNNPNKLIVLYGQDEYDNLAEAQAAGTPSALPNELGAFSTSILISKIIIEKSAAVFADIQNPFDTTFTSTTPSNHQNLAGLLLAASGVTYGHVDDQAQTLYGTKTFNSFPVTPSSAPTTDYQAANKKYVDDTGKAETIQFAISDETTALAVGTAKITFRMPFAMTLTDVRASVTTAPTGANLVFDINENGVTVLSTKLSIDTGEKTSTTAATPPVISDANLADDAEITVDIDQIGSTVAGAGAKILLKGTRA